VGKKPSNRVKISAMKKQIVAVSMGNQSKNESGETAWTRVLKSGSRRGEKSTKLALQGGKCDRHKDHSAVERRAKSWKEETGRPKARTIGVRGHGKRIPQGTTNVRVRGERGGEHSGGVKGIKKETQTNRSERLREGALLDGEKSGVGRENEVGE